MGRLEGKTALITGAAAGIGLAIATRFAKEGSRLVLVDISADLQAIAKSLTADDGSEQVLVGDVANEETLRRAVSQALDRFGRLDILVNNAFHAVNRSVTELKVEEWQHTLDVCLTAIFYGVKHAIPVMQRQSSGSIINMSSVNALLATPGMPAYSAAKGAIVALTRQLAVEYGPYGIRTNAICPGFIATGLVRDVLSNPDELKGAVESCPLRRVGQPEDIASATLFLASDESSFINGHILTVDGGTSAQWPMVVVRPGLRRKMGLSPLPIDPARDERANSHKATS